MHTELSFMFSHISSNRLQASLQSISKAQTPLGNSLASTANSSLENSISPFSAMRHASLYYMFKEGRAILFLT